MTDNDELPRELLNGWARVLRAELKDGRMVTAVWVPNPGDFVGPNPESERLLDEVRRNSKGFTWGVATLLARMLFAWDLKDRRGRRVRLTEGHIRWSEQREGAYAVYRALEQDMRWLAAEHSDLMRASTWKFYREQGLEPPAVTTMVTEEEFRILRGLREPPG